MELKAAVGDFLAEFSNLENAVAGGALQALSRDAAFVERAQMLLGLDARLTLLLRLAAARAVSAPLMAELTDVVARARQLGQQRDKLARRLLSADDDRGKSGQSAARGTRKPRSADYARLADMDDLWVLSISEVTAYTEEALELQVTLSAISGKIDRHLASVTVRR